MYMRTHISKIFLYILKKKPLYFHLLFSPFKRMNALWLDVFAVHVKNIVSTDQDREFCTAQ